MNSRKDIRKGCQPYGSLCGLEAAFVELAVEFCRALGLGARPRNLQVSSMHEKA